MMNHFLMLLFLSLAFLNCRPATQELNVVEDLEVLVLPELPAIETEKSYLNYSTATSKWTYEGEVFSGRAVSYFPNGTLKESFGVLNGSKQNISQQWYEDGHLKIESNYHLGKLHGEKKSWSADDNHILVATLNYYKGKVHGEQKKWYTTGELFKVLHLYMGKEEGMQQAYRKNGDLFANYEARAGRIFGLKKAALCYGLEDEKIQYETK